MVVIEGRDSSLKLLVIQISLLDMDSKLGDGLEGGYLVNHSMAVS